MKIYTYYENINHTNQDEMLRLWEISWKNAGFDATVLTKKDAQNHSFYENFVSEIKNLHYQIMDKEINPYGLSCYVRWLAYSTQAKEKFYVSDYDCINNGLKKEELSTSNKLHLMDEACPCFAFGSSDQFEKLCYNFIEISLNRIQEIKKFKKNSPFYNDQEFFQYNFVKKYNNQADELAEKYNILLTRDRKNGVGPYEIDIINTCKVLHISHQNANNIKQLNENFKDYDINLIRIKIMEQIISNFNLS